MTSHTEPPYPRPAYAWAVVGILFLTAVLAYTDRQVLSLLVDPVRKDLRLGDTQMSLLMGAAFAVVYGVAGVPLGWFADRTSRRNMLLGGVAVWGVGTVACGLAHSFNELFAARLVVGLGEAVLSPAAISLISDYFPAKRRGLALGVYFTGIAMGVGGAYFIGGAIQGWVQAGLMAATPLAGMAPWRLVFIVLGAPSLIWGLVILVIREPLRRMREAGEATPEAGKRSPVDMRALMLSAPIFVAVAIASLVDNGVGAWAPSLLIRQFHADPSVIQNQLGIPVTIGYSGGVLLGGWLADRARAWRGPRGKIELCAVAALLILPACLLINAPSFLAVMVGVPLYFALSGAVTASGLSAILDATPNRVRGLAMGVSFFLNVAIGAGVGPTVVALAGDYVFGAAAGLGPAIVFTVAAFYAVAAAASLLALRTTRTA